MLLLSGAARHVRALPTSCLADAGAVWSSDLLPTMRVAVIGGGLGGLCLAQLLQTKRRTATAMQLLEVCVYERDAGPTGRSQGYQIGVDPDGTKVLHAVPGLEGLDALLRLNKQCGFVMTDPQLRVLLEFEMSRGSASQPPSMALVNRWRLREILAQSNGLHIEWNKKFARYEEIRDGDTTFVRVHFDDGSHADADFVVGADGVNSKVRQQLRQDLELEPIPVSQTGGFLPLTEALREKCPNLTRFGEKYLSRVAGRDGTSLLSFAFVGDSGDMFFLWAIGASLSAWPSLSPDPAPEEAHGSCVTMAERHFHPEVLQLVRETPITNVLGPHALRIVKPTDVHPHMSARSCRVSLLGDAAHAMTTHRGLGANTAFQDAADLADAIITGLGAPDWPQRLEVYERKMFRRGFANSQSSLNSTRSIFLWGPWKSWFRDWMLWTAGRVLNIVRFVRRVF